jgi:two-component system, cell cycle response regulator
MSNLFLIRVLLIEDEAGDAYLVKTALRQSQDVEFNVTWVQSLREAKQNLASKSFDVILLDLSLPDSEGLATVELTRCCACDIPIVVLTGRGDMDFSLTALKAGANDYMIKGDFGFNGLARVIRYTLLRSEMEAENRLLVAALNAAVNSIVITDINAVIKWANPAFTKLTGYELDEALNRKPGELVRSDKQNPEFYTEMWSKLLVGEQWQGELINKRKDGSLYYEDLSIAPVKNARGEITNFVGVKQDISHRKQLEEMLQNLANTDPLTSLFNRRVFLEYLTQEAHRVARSKNCAAVLMLDLDFFKRINDTYGHATGDDVLKKFAAIILENTRDVDIAARFGGEEFVILLPDSNRESASIMAERLRKAVSMMSIAHEKGNVTITVSIGAALLIPENANGELALSLADNALYEAKETGRNRICWA